MSYICAEQTLHIDPGGYQMTWMDGARTLTQADINSLCMQAMKFNAKDTLEVRNGRVVRRVRAVASGHPLESKLRFRLPLEVRHRVVAEPRGKFGMTVRVFDPACNAILYTEEPPRIGFPQKALVNRILLVI